MTSRHLLGFLVCLTVSACSNESKSGGNGGASGDGGGGNEKDGAGSVEGGSADANFFVTSDTSKTGNLGGLSGADARCERLAAAAGLPSNTWHAYLGVERGPDDGPVNPRDRIGSGPWHNVAGGLLATDLDALHARTGDADVFLDENGGKINGQWEGSPSPVEHDVLTGANPNGTVMAGKTCDDWTSDAQTVTAQIGHSDGLGPNLNGNPPFSSWNSSHANGGCNDTAPLGGAGRLYCFGIE